MITATPCCLRPCNSRFALGPLGLECRLLRRGVLGRGGALGQRRLFVDVGSAAGTTAGSANGSYSTIGVRSGDCQLATRAGFLAGRGIVGYAAFSG